MNLEIQSITPNATPTRRRVIACAAAGIAALAARRAIAQSGQAATQQKPSSTANATLTSLHYDIDFKATPQRIYAALIDAKQFAAFSGLAAEIDPKPGGAFSLFAGQIGGRNVELVENQRIVQAWRPGHWDAGIYSIAHFELKPRGAEASLAFDHTGFPAGEHDGLDWGWHHHYWDPLTKYLAGA